MVKMSYVGTSILFEDNAGNFVVFGNFEDRNFIIAARDIYLTGKAVVMVGPFSAEETNEIAKFWKVFPEYFLTAIERLFSAKIYKFAACTLAPVDMNASSLFYKWTIKLEDGTTTTSETSTSPVNSIIRKVKELLAGQASA